MGRPSSADTASHVSGRTGERTETKGTGTTRPPQATITFTQKATSQSTFAVPASWMFSSWVI